MKNTIEDFRVSLDNIDNAIIFLLAERFHITKKVGEYKKIHNLPAQDLARETSQFKRIKKLAKQAGLNGMFATKIFRLIIDEVISNHKDTSSQ